MSLRIRTSSGSSPVEIDKTIQLAKQTIRLSNQSLNEEEFKNYVDTLTMLETHLRSLSDTPLLSEESRFELEDIIGKLHKLRPQSQKVFISYSHDESSALAALIDTKLEQNKYDVFLDRKITPGTDWKDILRLAIQNSQYFVCIVSPSLIDSKSMRMEIQTAIRSKVQMIPIWLPNYNSYLWSPHEYMNQQSEDTSLSQLLSSVHAIRIKEESADAYNEAANKLIDTFRYLSLGNTKE